MAVAFSCSGISGESCCSVTSLPHPRLIRRGVSRKLKRAWSKDNLVQKKRSADRAAPETPAKGRKEQHLADAPLRGGPSTASLHEPFGSNWRFFGKQFLKLAFHQVVTWPLLRPRQNPGHLLQYKALRRLATHRSRKWSLACRMLRCQPSGKRQAPIHSGTTRASRE